MAHTCRRRSTTRCRYRSSSKLSMVTESPSISTVPFTGRARSCSAGSGSEALEQLPVPADHDPGSRREVDYEVGALLRRGQRKHRRRSRLSVEAKASISCAVWAVRLWNDFRCTRTRRRPRSGGMPAPRPPRSARPVGAAGARGSTACYSSAACSRPRRDRLDQIGAELAADLRDEHFQRVALGLSRSSHRGGPRERAVASTRPWFSTNIGSKARTPWAASA